MKSNQSAETAYRKVRGLCLLSSYMQAGTGSAQTDPEQLRSCLDDSGSEAKHMIDLTDALLKLCSPMPGSSRAIAMQR
ncbi:MAG TPA: hypothetical protein V6D22_05855 [Candidatus Obscuribacterales bacterium]